MDKLWGTELLEKVKGDVINIAANMKQTTDELENSFDKYKQAEMNNYHIYGNGKKGSLKSYFSERSLPAHDVESSRGDEPGNNTNQENPPSIAPTRFSFLARQRRVQDDNNGAANENKEAPKDGDTY